MDLSRYTYICPPEMLKFLVTFPFSIVAEPEALTITPSTPPEKEATGSQPALTSHPSDIFPLKDAFNLTEEPEPDLTLTLHEIEPFALAFKETRGKAGKTKVKICGKGERTNDQNAFQYIKAG